MDSSQKPQTPPARTAKFCFNGFEVDPQERELRRDGVGIRIQDQPFRILLILLERPGKVVTREELREKIWPADTIVEFEHSLNTAVNKLRRALNDSTEKPRYVETVPRRGYRFIGELQQAQQVEMPETDSSSPKAGRRWWIWASALGCAALFAGTVAWRSPGAGREPLFQATLLTSYKGLEGHPTFSPDGNQVAFSWNGQNESNTDIYVKVVGTGAPLRLTSAPQADEVPVWSPNGRWIAFVRRQTTGLERGEVFVVSPLGGGERKIGDTSIAQRFGTPTLAWTPDGKWLAVRDDGGSNGPRGLYLLSVETGERRLLVASVTSIRDHGAAFARDGKRLVFVRNNALHMVSLNGLSVAGEPKRLTNPVGTEMSPIWSADEKEIVFARQLSFGVSSLWRLRVDGAGAAVTQIPQIGSASAVEPAIPPKGGRLAYSERVYNVNTWKLPMKSAGVADAAPAPIVMSSRFEGTASLSPDGERMAFTSNRTGAEHIWLARIDGSHPFQLTHHSGAMTGMAKWSPDGKFITYDAYVDGSQDIYVVSAAGGAPQRITGNPHNDWIPEWSADGKWIYYSSDKGGPRVIWKRGFPQGPEVRVTRDGGLAAGESPDGRYFCYFSQGLWVMPMKDGVPNEAGRKPVRASASHLTFDITNSGIYFAEGLEGFTDPRARVILFYEFATGRTTTVFAPGKQLAFGLSVSRDERLLLFSQFDAMNGDLMTLEPFP